MTPRDFAAGRNPCGGNFIFILRPCKEAALTQLASSTYSPLTPCVSRRGCSSDETWTPSALLAFENSMQEFGLTPENAEGPVQVFNSCMDSLANAVRKPRIDPLQSQGACWENCSNADRSAVIHNAEEACQLICDVIAPNDGKQLFQAMVQRQQNKGETGGAGIQALVIAY